MCACREWRLHYYSRRNQSIHQFHKRLAAILPAYGSLVREAQVQPRISSTGKSTSFWFLAPFMSSSVAGGRRTHAHEPLPRLGALLLFMESDTSCSCYFP